MCERTSTERPVLVIFSPSSTLSGREQNELLRIFGAAMRERETANAMPGGVEGEVSRSGALGLADEASQRSEVFEL
jgi:hypothetical protein